VTLLIFVLYRTSAVDPYNHMLYFQLHIDDGSGTFTESLCKIGFTQSKLSGEWYPYINTAMWPMQFGYSAFQFATIKEG